MRIAYNPLYKPDGKTKVGALTSAPINDIVFDLPGKSIWAKGLKFLGTDSLKIIIGSSSDTVAGTWTGQHSEIGRYEDGLTIIYIPKVAGASTTTLNINGLGAKMCYYSGNSKLTTHYPAGTPILFTYYNDGWRRADYDSNTNYYRPIEVNDTVLLGNNNYVLNFKSDGNISYVTTAATNTSKQADLTIGINIQNLKNNLGVSTIINNASTNDQLPTSKSVYDFVGTYLTSYMHWKGNTPSSGTTFTIPNAASVGDAYRIAVAGTIPAANSITGSAQIVEVGDIIICTDATGPKYTVAQTNWTTIVGTSTLAWNSEVTLATIGGLAIKAKLPANPTLALKSISFTKADGTVVNYNGSSTVDLTGGINYATLANQVRNNLIIKLNGGTTEGTNLFTYNGSAAKTINITPASIGAATSGHTHTTTIAASTDTNQIALIYGGKYKLTAGGTTYVFTMPASDNTWRPIGTGATDAAAGNHTHDGRYLRWNGSAADISAMGWGTLTSANGYTILSHAASSDGGDMGFVNKGGKIFMQLDGYYYQNEGRYRVLDTSDFTAFSNAGSQTTRITIGGVTKDLKIDADTVGNLHASDFVRAFSTSNDNIDSDWGQSFKTFDPIPLGTPPEQNPNISLLNIGNNFARRKQLAFMYNNDNIYYRRRTEGGFSSWKKLAFTSDIPTVTNYYWANVKISSSSSTTTTPTFAIATATTSVTTPLVSSTGRLTLNTTNTALDLKFNNDDTKSVILNGTEFKPFDAANNKLTLGSASARWSNIYSVLGNFTGNINGNYFISNVATGTQPYACTSTTLNTNLNADLLDGYHEASFYRHRGAYGKSHTAASTEYNLGPGTYITKESGYSGALLSFNSSGSTSCLQFWTPYWTGSLSYRISVDSNRWGKTDGAWTNILDSDNYTSYTVKKDGTGASGTWGINISGNANTSSYPAGFDKRQTSTWATGTWRMPGTWITGWGTNSGADIAFAKNGGALNVATDGYFYQGADYGHGLVRVMDDWDRQNTTWVNADKLDGVHNGDVTANYYNTRGQQELNLSSLDANTWYPCVMQAHPQNSTPIRVTFTDALNYNKPSWSTHPNGFSFQFDFEWIGGGWGTIPWYLRVYRYGASFGGETACYGLEQRNNRSALVLYMRGGTSYYYRTTDGRSFTVYSTTTNIGDSTYPDNVSPRTSKLNDCFLQEASSRFGTCNRASYADNASTVTVNNSDANSTYRIVQHSNNTLYSTAGIYCNPGTDCLYAAHYYETSDIRNKNILNSLNITSKQLSELPLFYFTWKDKPEDGLQSGTSAQAVQTILPTLVSGEDILHLDYATLGTIAGITACKELVNQKSEIDLLKERIEQLEQQLKMYHGNSK